MEELKSRQVSSSSQLTPLAFLDHAASVYGDLPSVVYGEVTYTWSQTRTRCVRLASALNSVFKISVGDVVSVLAPNVPAMYEMHFGIPMSGAVLNTFNIRLDARTLSVQLQHSESKLVFVDQDLLEVTRQAFSLLKSQDSSLPLPCLVLLHEEEEEGGRDGEMMTYEGLLAKGDPKFQWFRPRSEWTPIVLNYTSGTTSDPKGVVHCHRSLYLTVLHTISGFSLPKHTVYLWILPMFHANGWAFPWVMAALGGVNICLRRFSASATYASIHRHNVNLICCAPVVLNMLATHYDQCASTTAGAGAVLPGKDVHIIIGGSPPQLAVLIKMESLGFTISHGYGQTESIEFLLLCEWKQRWNKLPASERARLKARQGVRSIGMTSVDVIDPKTGQSVERDGTKLGEIVVSGPCVMLGYLKNPEATEKCIRGEQSQWLYTGDMAVVHPDGYIEIKDRLKDIIISGGENISSMELESVLCTHPLVHEAVVVARPDKFLGESPCAFVCLKKGECESTVVVTGKEIMAFCREKLPHYMVPRTVVFKEELVKTATGKIKKQKYREMAKELELVPEPLTNHGRQ